MLRAVSSSVPQQVSTQQQALNDLLTELRVLTHQIHVAFALPDEPTRLREELAA